MKIHHTIFTLALVSLMLSGCQWRGAESEPQPDATQQTATESAANETDPPHKAQSDSVDAGQADDAEEIGEDNDEEYAEDYVEEFAEQFQVSASSFTEEDASWTAHVIKEIKKKTERLLLPMPDSEEPVILRYRDIVVYGQGNKRVICGHFRPENAKLDNGKDFPFMIDTTMALNISARENKSAVFERKWQLSCTLKDGRSAPLNEQRTGLLWEK